MPGQEHQLSFAAFLVTKDLPVSDKTLIDSSVGDGLYGKALIRKLCLCGSGLIYNSDQRRWFCSESSTEIELNGFNLEPLEVENLDDSLVQAAAPALRNHNTPGMAILDGSQETQVLIKVPQQQLWLIADPLPVWEHIHIRITPTAPVVEWSLDIGHSSGSSLYTKLQFNIRDTSHSQVLIQLTQQPSVLIQFVDSDNLSPLATKYIQQPFNCQKVIREAMVYSQLLDNSRYDFSAALADLAMAEEFSRVSMSVAFDNVLKNGPCPFLVEEQKREADVFEIAKHVVQCQMCRKVYGNLFDDFLKLFGEQ